MKNMFPAQRRQLLKAGGLACAGLSLPWSMSTPAAGQALQWRELDAGLALVSGAGGNVLVGAGSDGVLMVDGGHADHAETLLDMVMDHLGAVPRMLFNTHCHRDQIGCNEVLGKNGATIVAHENTRLWLGTEIISKWEDRTYPPVAEVARPNQTFYEGSRQLHFNEALEYGYLPQGHTDGDIYVFFPERNLLMAGDVVAPVSYPVLDYSTNGWIGGMINSLELLLEIADSETRIVASSGDVVARSFLQTQLDMCYTLIERIGSNYYAGLTFQDFLASAPSAEFDARWGDPGPFLHTAYEGTWGHITEVRRYGRR